MTLEEMKKEKQERGYSYAMISEYSGVPVPTIQKIFQGETKSPRYETLRALEKVFEQPFFLRERMAAHRIGLPDPAPGAYCAEVSEAMSAYRTDDNSLDGLSSGKKRDPLKEVFTRQGTYTVDDYYMVPDERRVELIDGVFYDMGAPTGLHQLIAGEVYRQIANYILDQGGECIPWISPIDVQLDCDDRTMIQPDVLILCDPDKEQNGRIFGAPDFVLEVVSPSTLKKDTFVKLKKYMNAGVREYWIINPFQEKVLIYWEESDEVPMIRGLTEPIPVNIYGGKLCIDPKHILRYIRERVKQ